MAGTSHAAADPPLSQCPEPIAVVGMGCRWPGGVRNPSQLWDLLKEGRDGWSEFSEDRINVDGWYHPDGPRPGSMFTRGGYLLQENTRDFDHSFFGITATEAMALDPSQRKLLEVTYEAVESAGVPLEKFFGSRTGVFVGNFNNEHQLMQYRDPDFTLPYVVTGGGPTILSNRINYVFNLQGPSLMVDTACSASMYALHLAVTSIRNGDCDAAIVAGANVILGPDNQIFTTKLGAVSPTSRCHTFDIAADGYGRAEGFGALYLKKLSDAVSNGDPIRAVVRGTSFNANGRTGGISHPSPDGQEAVMRQAYKAAGGLNPDLTGYAECHGTGTPVGDPIEVSAVGRVFSSGREGDPLLIGSIKPNLGHSEAASAMSQIMKAILAMEHGQIPPTIRIKKFNPSIDFDTAKVKVVTEMTPWPANRLRRVSINSFGYGGANAHCILDHPTVVIPGYKLRGFPATYESIPPALSSTNGHGNGNGHHNGNGHANGNGHSNGNGNNNGNITPPEGPPLPIWCQPAKLRQVEDAGARKLILLPVSGHDERALKSGLSELPKLLKQYDTSGLLYTLGCRKSTFSRRAFAIAESDKLTDELDSDLVTTGKAPSSVAQRIGFVFTGQGAQWPRMGAQLLSEYSVFREAIQYLDKILNSLQRKPSWTIEEALLEPPTTSQINDPAFSQTICTALQIALLALLKQWGIEPVATVGHSSGEIAAAYAAGRLKASEAIVLAYFRGQVVTTNKRRGLMMAVGLGPDQARPYLDGIEAEVKIAAINSPDSVTLSGETEAIEKLSKTMNEKGIFARVLKTGGNAYHSHHMAALGEAYEELASEGLGEVKPYTDNELSNPTLKWVSSVTMKEESVVGPDYWRRNLESAVLFSPAVEKLAREERIDLMIEVGPHPALGGPLKQIRAGLEKNGIKLPTCLGSLRRGENDVTSMLTLAGNLFINNAPIDLVAVNATEKVEYGELILSHGFPCVDLPQYNYSYPETPVYFENRFNKEYRTRKHLRHDILGARVPAGSRTHGQWRNVLRLKDLPWLEDHKLLPHAVLPGAAYITMAIEAVSQMHLEAEDAAPIKSFKLRQVAINSALRIEDTELGVETVLDMEKLPLTTTNANSQWYKFSIGSMVPNTDVWTQHCTGTISAVTTETSIDERERIKTDPRSRSLDISRWHKRFHVAGLGYGPAFQGLSNLRAYRGSNIAASEVALKPTSNFANESKYTIHPATLDTMIQLSLISAHAGQVENLQKAFVPIFADDVSIWIPESDNQQGLGVASGKILGLRSMYARAQLFTPSGAPLLDIGELKCVSYEGTLEAGHSNIAREPYWRPVARADIDTLTPAITRAMFPPQDTPSSFIASLEGLATHVLASIANTLQDDTIHEKTQNHDVFANWVKSWASSPEHKDSVGADKEGRLAIIDKLASELKDIPEAKSLKVLHDNLDLVLRGETNSIKVLMESNLLAELSTSGILVSGAYSQLQHAVDLLAHKNPRMRILEVGAGSAGATSPVLETLASGSTRKRFHEYVFTDSAGWCVTEAKSQFSGHDGLVFQTLDVLQDPISQGFEANSFDLIIAANVVSQTENLEAGLKHIYSLLKPSGSLLMLETTRSTVTSEIISRTLTGKWDQERMSFTQDEWNTILRQYGFSGVDLSLEDYQGEQQMSTVMLSKTPGIKADTQKRADVYLVYRESLPLLVEATINVLGEQGLNAIPIELFSSHEIPKSASVISFVDLNGTMFTCRDESYFKALQVLVSDVSAMVWVAADLSIPGESSIMKGFLRSIATENVLSKYVFVELDYTDYTPQYRAAELLVHKLNELQESMPSQPVDLECVLRGGLLYVERLVPALSLNEQFSLRNGFEDDIQERPIGTQGPLMARYQQPGVLSSLYYTSDLDFSKPLDNDWVEIKTEAIGLNMKDLAVATARFDLDKLSTEGAGVVTRIGAAVTSLKPGDRVFGIIPGNMGNYLRSPASVISKIPDGISTDGAASMPVVFLTALYALEHLAHLERGESILIQSATGGLGMAAIQVAKHLGAEVYATVGTDEKRKVLIEEFGIPSNRIFNSRKLSAVDDILQATGQQGLDVILSSTGGDSMHETWRCIAPLGRFIDVGRTDVLGGGRLGLEVFKRNATFSSFDMGLIYRQKPSLISKLMAEMTELIDQGVVGPIKHLTTFDISRLESAMSTFSKGLHTGKFVITFHNPASALKADLLKISRPVTRATFDPNAAYLLVGCLGGLGRSLAAWMVERGARHLVFLSRSGADKPETAAIVKELVTAGAAPDIIRCDVTDKTAVVSVVGRISAARQVKGVIHAAMVEGDAFFNNATWSQIRSVLAPKVQGSVNLHHATKNIDLDFFLMTSSIVGTVGTPSQGAYTAANAFQDAFGRFRLSQGLPSTVLGLGLILEVGSVSASVGFQQMLQRNATYGVSETEFLQLLEGALCSPKTEEPSASILDPTCPAQMVTGLEPTRFLSYLESGRVNDLVWYNNARFGAVRQAISDRAQALASAGSGTLGGASSVATQLQNASSPAEKLAIAREAVATRLAELLGIAADDVDSDKPVSRYGVDSLVAGELRNWLIKTFGLELTMLQLLNKSTRIEDLVKGAAGV
ncbi:putative polyketide synthase [Xylaria cf. heliscus]|nr:putative polyketide synthase [Xylaria cf. heliscus]